MTGALGLAILIALEQMLRVVFEQNQHWHVLLEQEIHRQILARHIGVDAVSCAAVGCLGWAARQYWWPVLTGQIPVAGWEERLFKFQPDGYRVALFFFTYQVKNMIDTLVWGDVSGSV